MNLTANQVLSIIAAVLAALVAATAQLTDIFGPTTAKTIVSAASLANMVLTGILAGLTSQKSQIQNVAAMPGVEKITVNAQANQTLAQVAVSNDPVATKVEAIPTAAAKVEATAKGT